MPIDKKKLLKGIVLGLGGAGAVGGAGYVGHKIGYKIGARNMADSMSREFGQMNQQENSAIAQSFYQKGLKDAIMSKQAVDMSPVKNIASAIWGAAKPGIKAAPKKAFETGVQSFSNLGNAASSFKNLITNRGNAELAGQHAKNFVSNLGNSKAALGTIALSGVGAKKLISGRKDNNSYYGTQY